ELRSEVLNSLEGINKSLMDLQAETEDFASKLGVFPPETFAGIKWLLEVSSFLTESPKPESYWLTNTSSEKLRAEAKNYWEISIWIGETRAKLMERYHPSLFDLVLNESAEFKKQLEALSRTLLAVELEDSEFLPQREKFLALVRSTQFAARKWRETSQALAPILGLDSDGLTLNQVKELSRMALLCFSEDKPEPQWFDNKYFEQVADIVAKAKRLYQDHDLMQKRLDETYTNGFYQLDLDGLIARYNSYSQSSLKLFNSSYRNDQKQIARVTNDGRVPKTILTDLIDARKVKKLQAQIEESTETVRTLLGHFYNKSKTDFQGAEKALELTAEIRKLNW